MRSKMQSEKQKEMQSELQKPAIVVIDELKEKIRTDINGSGIHWVLLEPLIRDLYEETGIDPENGRCGKGSVSEKCGEK